MPYLIVADAYMAHGVARNLDLIALEQQAGPAHTAIRIVAYRRAGNRPAIVTATTILRIYKSTRSFVTMRQDHARDRERADQHNGQSVTPDIRLIRHANHY